MPVSQRASKWLPFKVFVALKFVLLLHKLLDSDAAKTIKITVSTLSNVDYQFHVRTLATHVKQDPKQVVSMMKDNIPDNLLIDRLEISDNNSYGNIFTKTKRQNPCKTCGNGTQLGRQNIAFRKNDQNVCEHLTRELSKRFSENLMRK